MRSENEMSCHCRKCGCIFSYFDGYEYAIDAIICPQCRITQFRDSAELVIDSPDD